MDITTKNKFKELLKSITEGSICRLSMDRGQTWGGAGAMVLFDDVDTITAYKHADTDEKLITKHAAYIGEIYYQIREIVGKLPWYDYLSKYYFWGELTGAGKLFADNNKMASENELAIFLVNNCIKLVDKLDHAN